MDSPKHNIVEAATKNFQLYGFKCVTMDTVAREGHISKKTIYKYFRDKESLIDQVLDELGPKIENEISHIAQKTNNPLEACFHIYYCIGQHPSDRISLFHSTLKHYYPEHYTRFYDMLWKLLKQTTTTHLTKAIAKKLIIPDVDQDEFCFVLINNLLSITNQNLFVNEMFETNKLIEDTIYYSLRSIATRKGQKTLVNLKNNLPEYIRNHTWEIEDTN